MGKSKQNSGKLKQCSSDESGGFESDLVCINLNLHRLSDFRQLLKSFNAMFLLCEMGLIQILRVILRIKMRYDVESAY